METSGYYHSFKTSHCDSKMLQSYIQWDWMHILHPVKIIIVITFLNKPHGFRDRSCLYDELICKHVSTNKEQNVKSDIGWHIVAGILGCSFHASLYGFLPSCGKHL